MLRRFAFPIPRNRQDQPEKNRLEPKTRESKRATKPDYAVQTHVSAIMVCTSNPRFQGLIVSFVDKLSETPFKNYCDEHADLLPQRDLTIAMAVCRHKAASFCFSQPYSASANRIQSLRINQSKSASSSCMNWTASRISDLSRAPVMTILPLPKIRQTTLG